MKFVSLIAIILGLTATAVIAQDAPPPPVLKVARPQVAAQPTPSPEEKEPEVDESDVVRVSTSLITIPAEVIDRNGRYAGNLKKEDFHLFENGVE